MEAFPTPHTEAPVQLHVDGRPLAVLTQALVSYRELLERLKKADKKAGLPTDNHDAADAVAADLLAQLGYRESSGTDTAETIGQMPLPFGDQNDGERVTLARVKCLACSRMFAVPPGDTVRACPDCSTAHRVKADNDGTVFYHRMVPQIPFDLLALIRQKQADDADPLTPAEEKRLAAWLKENPEYVLEPAESGARVADPDVLGSGNPLRIDCARIRGVDCEGFDSTDTPGTSLCQRCGGKYTVEIIEGIINVRTYDAERDEPKGE